MQKLLSFIYLQLLLLTISFLILIIFFPIYGEVDLNLIQPWMSPHGEFFLKSNWYLDNLNHRYVKQLLIMAYVSFLGLWIASFKFKQLLQHRTTYLYLFLMIILSTSVIGILKSQSDHACPWNMVIPSGDSYTWQFNQIGGHCFPGGHASTGFALLVGYFVYRAKNRSRAIFYLVAALILGLGMGWAQMMRGAHFFSHNLWTGWIIWFINVLVYTLTYSSLKNSVFENKQPKI